MSEAFIKVFKKPFSTASFSSELPLSVMAMKCLPGSSTAFSMCAQKKLNMALGSTVEPDLLDTMNRVVAMSRLSSVFSITSGSVVSSTVREGWPSALGNILLKTSGQRLDPPMPRSTTSFMPAACTSLAKSLISSIRPSMSGTQRSHPRRFLIFSCTSASSLHTDGSSFHMRLRISCFSSSVIRFGYIFTSPQLLFKKNYPKMCNLVRLVSSRGAKDISSLRQ